MGQGTISGGGDKGLYTLALDFGVGRRDNIKAQYEARIAVLNAQLPELMAKRGTADEEIEAASAAEDSATRFYIEALLVEAPPQIMKDALDRLTAARRRSLFAEGAKLQIEIPIDNVKADIKALQLQIADLMSGDIEKTLQAWCVDLTEDGAGPVATIEVPGEPTAVLIAPGCRGPAQSDGVLLARQVMTPSQAFFNAAILPGWQKFKPTYRVGTITKLHPATDTADVTVDSATSSAQSLDVNQQATLTGIPVEYMTCNAGAFEDGDRVVVQFAGQAQAGAKVIGFVDNPRSCNWACVFAHSYYYSHFFECTDDAVWTDVYTASGITIEYRLNRGAWASIAFDYTINFSGPQAGRPPLHVWRNPPPPGEITTADPYLEIGPLTLSVGSGWTDPSIPKINGLTLNPGQSFTGTVPTIAEVRIWKGDEILFNGAFRWDPINFVPATTEVRAQGGIFIKALGSIAIERLTGYELFIATGD